MITLFYGIIIGFTIGMVIGPIAILCIKRSITNSFALGLSTGLGAAATHLIFGSIAVFGLTIIENIFVTFSVWLQLFGGAYLLYLAYSAYSKSIKLDQKKETISYFQAIYSTFFLNLSNPITVTSYVALLSMYKLDHLTITSGVLLVLGIFLGSLCWWLFLSSISSLIGRHAGDALIKWINIAASILLFGFGASAIGSFAISMLLK